MKKFYAAINKLGFANSWDVLVFHSKDSRDRYVNEMDGYNHVTQRVYDCRAIRRDQVTSYANNLSLTQNCDSSPKPFSGECWMISDVFTMDDPTPGLIGSVFVGIPGRDPGERLFNR